MSDHIDRTAEVIENLVSLDIPGWRWRYSSRIAKALDAAGLLATKEAEVWERGYLMGYRDSDLGRYAHYTRNPYIEGETNE